MKPTTFLAIAAAACIARAAEPAVPENPSAPPPPKPVVDVVFVLDSTGSMSGLIEGAKEKIWSIANSVIAQQPAPTVRIGLVSYRDRGDEYVTQRHRLTGEARAHVAEVQVGATDTRGRDFHQQVAGADFGPWDLIDPYIQGGVQDSNFHVRLPS